MAGTSIFAFGDVKESLLEIDVHMPDTGDLTEPQSTLQADQGHQPGLMAAAVQLRQKGTCFLRLEEAFSSVIQSRHGDGVEWQRAVIQAPGNHSAHDPADQAYQVADGLGRQSLSRQAGHESVQGVWGDFLQQGASKDGADMGVIHPLVGVVSFALCFHPVVSIPFPGSVQYKAGLLHGEGRAFASADGLGFGDQPQAFLVRKGCRDAFTGPADIASNPFSLSIAVINRKAEIWLASMAALWTLPDLYALISGGPAHQPFATILRPFSYVYVCSLEIIIGIFLTRYATSSLYMQARVA